MYSAIQKPGEIVDSLWEREFLSMEEHRRSLSSQLTETATKSAIFEHNKVSNL